MGHGDARDNFSLFMFLEFFLSCLFLTPQCSRFPVGLSTFLPVQPTPKENSRPKKSRKVTRRNGDRNGVLAVFFVLAFDCFTFWDSKQKILPRVSLHTKLLHGVSAEKLGHLCTFMWEKMGNCELESRWKRENGGVMQIFFLVVGNELCTNGNK